jgi:thiamine phosphate synthase YjbQ (UPF0047 family)
LFAKIFQKRKHRFKIKKDLEEVREKEADLEMDLDEQVPKTMPEGDYPLTHLRAVLKLGQDTNSYLRSAYLGANRVYTNYS